MTEIVHTSVLLQECLNFLAPETSGALMVDGTLGEGGHSEAFLSAFPDLVIIGIDADSKIQERARERLDRFGSRMRFYNGWSDDFFSGYPAGEKKPDIILLDLGISLFHYEKSGRGFSFRINDPLDMRLNSSSGKSAADIVNTYNETDLANLIYINSEERYSRVIAKKICESRKNRPFATTQELAEVIYDAVPSAYRHGRIHPATKTFQALRIAVNSELERLPGLLELAFGVLAPAGRLGVITFHSLEDRIVKNYFRLLSKACTCGPEVPICKCGGKPKAELITKKSVSPSADEILNNPPSRSARLRVLRKKR
ncbi:16S rRNA (cytosine(1402)-N(4))-methyltransferase RsmH [Brucepastera parasyntrophica]|uniref:16S rRNA (cytosine(1402)-N(4))-methyltransferase RsmH n=1 Tax=Brucepastera parasyntrophica TaxID=2880008 RepID=UPI00210DFBCC|nr:16S rRNA (cytosine(1402)-N(4))-methyltransferase RsmH [Brucepastera parasyntrophica]ULQ60174.1 16S rRNA (cytosine(1402)-N(4))-methyltransferase RsmH [Brucepastera parasyntrophica]